jgi:hypothetical protein
MQKIIILLVFIFAFSACADEPSEPKTIADTKALILSNKSVEYDYISTWDNRFNDTDLYDTTFVQKQLTPNNIHGFQFYAGAKDFESFYDGKRSLQVNHNERMLIATDDAELQSDSSYFQYKMAFLAQPSDFLAIDSTFTQSDTVIATSMYHLYSKATVSESTDGLPFTREELFMVDQVTGYPFQIKTTSIKGLADTTQIITNSFENLVFSNDEINFRFDENISRELGYPEVSSSDLAKANRNKEQQIGDKVNRAVYRSIDGKEIDIIPSKEGEKTVLMFSFIGCGGCEWAIKEMKAKSYELKEDVQLFYSSPLDKQATLIKYRDKKNFPFSTFAKDSEMDLEFNTYRYPTFFVLESDGTISDIFHGYGEYVEAILF